MNSYCRLCDKEFKSDLKHQVYCSVECREKATRQKMIERQEKERLKRRIKKKRFCSNCKKEISIYNEDSLCNTCTIDKRKVDKFLKDLKHLFDYEKK